MNTRLRTNPSSALALIARCALFLGAFIWFGHDAIHPLYAFERSGEHHNPDTCGLCVSGTNATETVVSTSAVVVSSPVVLIPFTSEARPLYAASVTATNTARGPPA